MSGSDGLSGMKNMLIKLLRDDYRLSDVKIIREYPARIKDDPLEKPCIAIGVDSAEMKASMGGYIGANAGGGLNGQILSVTMRLDIFSPALKPFDPYAIMDIICDILMLSPQGPRFTRVWGDGIAYDKAAEANRLTVRAVTKMAMTAEDKSPVVSAFRLERQETAVMK